MDFNRNLRIVRTSGSSYPFPYKSNVLWVHHDENNNPVVFTNTSELIMVRHSEHKSKLDIRSAVSPLIASMEQVGINKLLVHLVSSVPRRILEEYIFTFNSFKKDDYTDYFQSITASNDWPEDVR